MSIKEQVRRRLALGLAGVILGSALVVGVAPVAADNDTPEPRDVNIGMEASGNTSESHLTITEIAAPPVVSNSVAAPAQTAPVVENRDDRAPDAADGTDTSNPGDD